MCLYRLWPLATQVVFCYARVVPLFFWNAVCIIYADMVTVEKLFPPFYGGFFSVLSGSIFQVLVLIE